MPTWGTGKADHRVEAGCKGDHRVEAGCKGDHRVEAGCKADHRVEAGCKGDHRVEAGCKGDHRVDAGCKGRGYETILVKENIIKQYVHVVFPPSFLKINLILLMYSIFCKCYLFMYLFTIFLLWRGGGGCLKPHLMF